MNLIIDGKSIHYEKQGRGETIIFVHGWGGTIESLRSLADLASQKYQTIILDLPGFGQSDNPDPEWGIEEYSNLVMKLLDQLGIKKVHYFGHSFGGGIGMYIATNNTNIIQKLILCSSALRRSRKSTKSRLDSLPVPIQSLYKNTIRKIIYSIFFRNSDLLKFPHLESNFKVIMTQDLTEYAKKIKLPTLILWGEEDTYTPVSYAHELHEWIPNSQIKTFPGIRHNLPLKYPELVWGEVEKFLK